MDIFWKILFTLVLLVSSVGMCCRGVRSAPPKEYMSVDAGYYYVCVEHEDFGLSRSPIPKRPEEYYRRTKR